MALMGQVKKLRDYAGSREKVDEVAKFIRRFLDLQISRIGRAYIKKSSVVRYRFENKNKRAFLDTYHRIVDKLNYLDSKGIDYGQWLENKADKCLESFSDTLYINTIVNVNAFEPDIDELFAEVGDPWNPIRKFLGLPKGCEFPDGFIPKGWGISSDDFSELDNIARVMGDGFYYYKDGTQRRGKRHYVSNRYFIIKCDYSNFEEFKEKWYQKSLVSARPTWVEYEKWAMFPGVWNESGESLVHTKDIKWREK